MSRLLTLFLIVPAAYAAPLPLMPMPAKVQQGSGAMRFDANFTVAATGYTDGRLQAALQRLLGRLARQTGIPRFTGAPAEGMTASLQVDCAEGGGAYPALDDNESYVLDVTASGATLHAPAVAGAIHGLETFAQLVANSADGFQVPAVHIEDSPRFPWRGLMMDVSRHFMPVDVVKRNLDAMAMVKMNVFHWHLSDDQGFRVESKRFPLLQRDGSQGNYYTQDQIRDVVAYAAERGIRVVPEFDMPGHTASWLAAYPILASVPGPYAIWDTFGVNNAAIDPSRETTYQFLDVFIGEMTAMFPDPYFHIGGDEVNGRAWNQSPTIQQFIRDHNLKDNEGLQAYFNQRILAMVTSHGKTMIGWDEILHPDLPQATVIHSWRGQKSLADAVSKGYRGILSTGYYLDHLRPASYHYAVDPISGPTADLTPEQQKAILGGEACMWAEMANQETVDSRIWPRAAAIAERLWSPKEVTDVDSMYARLAQVSRMLDWAGVHHRSNYVTMLDRLSGGDSPHSVRVLADASEALGLGTGRRANRLTTSSPLNRFVDAARPESESVRRLEMQVRSIGAGTPDPALLASLRTQFQVWSANDAEFAPLAQDNALLAEVLPLSKDLVALGAIGLQTLDYLQSGQAPPTGWIAERTAELTAMRKPRPSEVALAAVRPVQLLLEALSQRGAQ